MSSLFVNDPSHTPSSPGVALHGSSATVTDSSVRNTPVLSLGATKKTSTYPDQMRCQDDALQPHSSKGVVEADTSSQQLPPVASSLETVEDTVGSNFSKIPTNSANEMGISASDMVHVSMTAGVNGSGTSPVETVEPGALSEETPKGAESATPTAAVVVDEELLVAMAMPAYNFITRPDLYSYLRESAPGVS